MESMNDRDTIPGWGADLDRSQRPAVPKERMPPRLDVPWDTPAQQASGIRVLHSIEREGITPVFGTSVPPSGLSGLLRKRAFRRSENDVRHWTMLLLADGVARQAGGVGGGGRAGSLVAVATTLIAAASAGSGRMPFRAGRAYFLLSSEVLSSGPFSPSRCPCR